MSPIELEALSPPQESAVISEMRVLSAGAKRQIIAVNIEELTITSALHEKPQQGVTAI
jgi:hypothetical protein